MLSYNAEKINNLIKENKINIKLQINYQFSSINLGSITMNMMLLVIYRSYKL